METCSPAGGLGGGGFKAAKQKRPKTKQLCLKVAAARGGLASQFQANPSLGRRSCYFSACEWRRTHKWLIFTSFRETLRSGRGAPAQTAPDYSPPFYKLTFSLRMRKDRFFFTSCFNRREMHHHFYSVIKRRRPMPALARLLSGKT